MRTAITYYHKLGGWKQQKLIHLQFWRPEVLNQSVSRVGFFLEAQREHLFHVSLTSSGGCQQSPTFIVVASLKSLLYCHMTFSLHVTMSKCPSSYKDIGHIGFGSNLMWDDLILIWLHL